MIPESYPNKKEPVALQGRQNELIILRLSTHAKMAAT
jgi:hypothetical protein